MFLPTNRSVWEKFDWTKLTTIAIVGFYDPELLCFAHQQSTRVVSLGNYPTSDLLDSNKRTEWVMNQVKYAQDHFLDGINIDFEDPLEERSPEAEALTQLTRETSDTFHRLIPGSQVTFDVPFAPLNDQGLSVDGRGYDFLALSQACDFLFVMSYDQQSQIYDDYEENECYAKPNSDVFWSAGGIFDYMKLNISVDKLVLGQPWYGYDYECLSYGPDTRCYIERVPFRGVNCSDAAGVQLPYSSVQALLQKYSNDWQYDPHSRTYSLLYKDTETGRYHQTWFDLTDSFETKYMIATGFSLRGVGMWTANYLDYTLTDQVKSMWSILPGYKSWDSKEWDLNQLLNRENCP